MLYQDPVDSSRYATVHADISDLGVAVSASLDAVQCGRERYKVSGADLISVPLVLLPVQRIQRACHRDLEEQINSLHRPRVARALLNCVKHEQEMGGQPRSLVFTARARNVHDWWLRGFEVTLIRAIIQWTIDRDACVSAAGRRSIEAA